MRWWAVPLMMLAASGSAQAPSRPPTWQQREAAESARVERVRAALAASGFRGVYALAENGRRLGGGAIGEAVPYEAVFPLPSFTRQVLAVMVMQQVEAGRIALDAPVSRYLPGRTAGNPSIGQLLRGAAPDAPLVALLERVTRRPVAELYAERVAGPTGMGALFQAPGDDLRADANWTGGPTPQERTASIGQLVGTAEDVLAFDTGLLDGRLLGPRLRGELLRTMAGPARPGCTGPMIDRAGTAGRFGMRNVILPGSATAMVLLTANGGTSSGSPAALCEGGGSV